MTGNDIYTRVLNISGYLNVGDVAFCAENLNQRIIDIINQICADLKISQIDSLENELTANHAQTDALCYGTAMLLAISQGDVEKNKLFSQIYNAKRSAALAGKEFIEDKLPSVSYGVD